MSIVPYAKIITYQLQTLELGEVPVSGVQSVSIDTSYNVSSVRNKFNPFKTGATNLMYTKPDVSVSITKFLSNNVLPVALDQRVSGIRGKNILPTGNVSQPIDIDLKILDREGSNSESGIIGFKIKDAILNSVSYNFSTDGNFEEQLSFSSHLIQSGIIEEKYKESETRDYEFHTGVVKRRKDFYISKVPFEISEMLNNGSILMGVNFSVGFSYGNFPSYGAFHSYSDKYVQYPYDITCTFEVLDRGFYNKPSGEYFVTQASGNPISVQQERSIYEAIPSNDLEFGISGYMNIYVGSGIYLQSRNRTGGEAGSNSYTTYSYTYKQDNSDFNISLL